MRERTDYRRRLVAGFAVLLLGWGAFLQLGFAAPARSQAGELRKVVTPAPPDNQFQFAGYYAALWQGYYREEGLDVEIRPALLPDGRILSATEAVADGGAEFGIGAADVLIAHDRGADLRIVASIFQQSAARA